MKTKYVLLLVAAAAAWGGTSDAAYTLHIDGRDDHSVEADLMLPLRAPAWCWAVRNTRCRVRPGTAPW